MPKDIHGCVAAVRKHFYRADSQKLVYTLPVEAYQLHRQLQYRICAAWNRFEADVALSTRECVLLAEAWLIAAPDHTKPMHVDCAWQPDCVWCGTPKVFHRSHPDNTPAGDPPRWLCQDGQLYEPVKYKEPAFGPHPTELNPNAPVTPRVLDPTFAYLYLTSGRKQWHHEPPPGWKEEAWERFDYVECGIFSKPLTELNDEDREWLRDYSRPNENFIWPSAPLRVEKPRQEH